MNGLFKIALALVGMLLLAGCAGFGYERAEGVPAQGSSFDRGLHDNYMKLSKSEFDQGDYWDSDKYANRAMNLAEGKDVQPEPIANRNLPADKVGELSAARARLVNAQASGAADKMPMEAASAQASFDCWMEQQEENFQPHDIAACRDGFMTAMAKLEEKPKMAEAAPAPTPVPAPMPTMAKAEPQDFTVHFDFDKAELTPDARAMLADVVKAAKKSDYQTVDIGGYTDLVGSDAYNDVLSERRANAVIDFLIQSGIEKEKIVGKGYGKADPVVAVQTPEMRNRRVEIKLEP